MPEGTHYIWGTGRRKASVARVRIKPGTGKFLVNKREANAYFTQLRDQEAVISPLKTLGMMASYDVFVNVGGGGSTGQAGAVLLGLARALSKHMPEVDQELRDKGLMTRDARMKERKKPGQPGARKRFQFSKR
ncbi:MAG: 30S ribosomal protein S9 [Phycisphaerae bacterium]|nr:30S ribosomal protein S9 [Phycisphaerae bacterium]